ncbi:hypothetical protein BDM02DRAFT_3170958 [Thelephora ganbajun]|uniref:Uncharacterized protein n=1 Tax=Thelephora ganbajun TaxID=370292 RepID=A0ACB6ZBX7_THEGA|nr:hypothetical protein BDM02DRAFT_3170958 [Thelephora ganbajun]
MFVDSKPGCHSCTPSERDSLLLLGNPVLFSCICHDHAPPYRSPLASKLGSVVHESRHLFVPEKKPMAYSITRYASIKY